MFSLFPPRWYSAESCIKDAAASWLNARPDGHRTLPSVSVPPIPSALRPCRQAKGPCVHSACRLTSRVDRTFKVPRPSFSINSCIHSATCHTSPNFLVLDKCASFRKVWSNRNTYVSPPKGFRAFVLQANIDNISQKSCHTLQFLLKKNIPMAVLEYIFFFPIETMIWCCWQNVK